MPENATGRNDFADRLLAWYDSHARDLPWRTPPGTAVRPDPYRVWLSEIMLQQTTVQAAKPYFARFMALWPDVAALAAADQDAVMQAWAGLGYYSRARNLKAAADLVVRDHDGRFPTTAAALKGLPGIGDYTANAIAAIACGQPEPVVDGNVERVIARHRALEVPLAEAKRTIRTTVAGLVPATRPGDFAQAMMDLGATVCAPRRMACQACPVAKDCAGRRSGDPLRFSLRRPKAAKPVRRAAAYVAFNSDGDVLLRRRPDTGLLAGMSEPPTSRFSSRADGATGAEGAPFPAAWRTCRPIAHVFTHFELRLEVWRAEIASTPVPAGAWWTPRRDLDRQALPSVMKKAIAAALAAERTHA